MTEHAKDPEATDRARTLFTLDMQIAAARAELARLQGELAGSRARSDPGHAERLIEANERLVVSALAAHELADAAKIDLTEATKISQRDALTNIPSRGLTLDRLETSIASARRRGRPLGVLFVDLDGLKLINDASGHAAGDCALRSAATRLTASVRNSDTVGRLGGDEFLVLLTEVGGKGDAALVAGKMLSALRVPVGGDPGAGALSASIGIAIFPHDGASGPLLVEHADQAMYRAKARGRGNFEFYDVQEAMAAAPASG
jgi:diguanylate cyclase (GGDEF)-like protein